MKRHLFIACSRAFTSSCARVAVLLSAGIVVLSTAAVSAQTTPPNTTVTVAPHQMTDTARHRSLVQAKDNLRGHLQITHSRLEQAERALKGALNRRDELTAKQNAMRSEVNKHDISVEGALPILQSLEKDKIAAEIQCRATESRITALQRAIARLTVKSQVIVKEDKVLDKLKRIVAHQRQKVERLRELQQKEVAVSAINVGDAEAALAEAELRVLLREEELSKGESAETLAAFNRQLIELTVDHAEYEARREFITERLGEIRPLMKLIEEYGHLERKVAAESIDALRTKVLESEQRLREAERAYSEVSRQLKELEAAEKSGKETDEKAPEKR